jgi:hypothetical protein
MDFLRRLVIPVPKVLAWSSRAQSTEVESEFIIMEKAEGESLLKSWETVDRVDLVQKLAQLYHPLLELHFTHYGSLCYKNDLNVFHKSSVDLLETVPAGLDISSARVPLLDGIFGRTNALQQRKSMYVHFFFPSDILMITKTRDACCSIHG